MRSKGAGGGSGTCDLGWFELTEAGSGTRDQEGRSIGYHCSHPRDVWKRACSRDLWGTRAFYLEGWEGLLRGAGTQGSLFSKSLSIVFEKRVHLPTPGRWL